MTDRTFMRAVVVLVALLFVALSVGVTAAFMQALDAAEQARSAARQSRETAQLLCRKINETNKGQIDLWTPVLVDSPPGATRDQFERNLHRLFDPVKC